jgi:hypothetical protein
VRRLLVAALSLSLVGAGAACSDSTSPGSSLSGTYSLRSVNNQTPPVVICDVSGCFAVQGWQLQLDANGNYLSTLQFQDQGSSFSTTQQTSGQWVLSGNQISLVDNNGGGTLNGTVSNGSITIFDNSTGATLVLTR